MTRRASKSVARSPVVLIHRNARWWDVFVPGGQKLGHVSNSLSSERCQLFFPIRLPNRLALWARKIVICDIEDTSFECMSFGAGPPCFATSFCCYGFPKGVLVAFMISPFDHSAVEVLEKVCTSSLLGARSSRLWISLARTTPANISVSLRLDPATGITVCGMRVIF